MGDRLRMEEAIRKGHKQYMKAGMNGEWNLVQFIADALRSAGFIHKSEARPELDEEAVMNIMKDHYWDSLEKDRGLIEKHCESLAKAICSKFSPKVVRLPKERIICPHQTVNPTQLCQACIEVNQALADIKKSLEEQGIKGE